MRTFFICMLFAACTSSDTEPTPTDAAEETETANDELTTSSLTCSPCPQFSLGITVCCIATHSCCR